MTIATLDVINTALRDINVIDEISSASAEQGAQCLARLNQMMAIWKGDSIDVGYYSLLNTSGNCPIPEYAELAVISGLSIAIATKFGASVSAEQVAIADSSISTLRRKLISEGLTNRDMSHLPQGTGKFGRGYDILNDA